MNTLKILLIIVVTALQSKFSYAVSQSGPDKLDLSGQWSCTLDEKDVGIAENWFLKRLYGVSIRLPGGLNENKVGKREDEDFQNISLGKFAPEVLSGRGDNGIMAGLKREYTYIGKAWYQKEIEINEDWKDKYLSLFLERCGWETTLWVDGKKAGSENSLVTPHIYDISELLVDAYLKGIGDFDAEKAFEDMKKSAMQDDFDIKYLKQYNYIPRDLAPTISVARTLEYAYDDYCIALMAEKLGKTEDYKYFSARSKKAFKNLFDPTTGFMRGKDSKGEFRKDFDPYNAVNANSDFIEGNSWQYTWFVPHNIPALIEGMGGKANFISRLDSLFSVKSALHDDTPMDVSGLIGQYAHGNEPSHHVAYLFNYGDQPWKTQERVNQIMTTLYTNKPDGLFGNEDMGKCRPGLCSAH